MAENIDYAFLNSLMANKLQGSNENPFNVHDQTGDETGAQSILAACNLHAAVAGVEGAGVEGAGVEGATFVMARAGSSLAEGVSSSEENPVDRSDVDVGADVGPDLLDAGARKLKNMASSRATEWDPSFMTLVEQLHAAGLKETLDSDDTDSKSSASDYSSDSCSDSDCSHCSEGPPGGTGSGACSPCDTVPNRKAVKSPARKRAGPTFSPVVVGRSGPAALKVRPNDEGLRRFAVDFPLSKMSALRCNTKACCNGGNCISTTSIGAITSLRNSFWGDPTTPPPNATVRAAKIKGN
jgi:hypothetical protein